MIIWLFINTHCPRHTPRIHYYRRPITHVVVFLCTCSASFTKKGHISPFAGTKAQSPSDIMSSAAASNSSLHFHTISISLLCLYYRSSGGYGCDIGFHRKYGIYIFYQNKEYLLSVTRPMSCILPASQPTLLTAFLLACLSMFFYE